MALDKITTIKGTAVPIRGNDIDTDRIIPARYMKVVTFDGLGDYMFHDVRKDSQGQLTNHILNDARYASASIMVVNSNFGCGSSREHAPQAIRRAGFDAVIGESFAEIFFGNSITLGMPCIEAKKEDVEELMTTLEAYPETDIEVDIEQETVSYAGKTIHVKIQATAKDALIHGRWDAIVELLENDTAIDKTASQLPYIAS